MYSKFCTVLLSFKIVHSIVRIKDESGYMYMENEQMVWSVFDSLLSPMYFSLSFGVFHSVGKCKLKS